MTTFQPSPTTDPVPGSITVVTVSIPGREHLLAEAGASLRAQTYGPVPWLVRIAQPDVFGPRHIARQRNALLKAVDTEWMAVLDDDDLLHPTYLERMAQHLDGADVVYSYCSSTSHPQLPFDPDLVRQGVGFIDGECCIRTEALRAVGGYPVSDVAEDFRLWPLMLDIGCVFRCVPEVLREHRAGEWQSVTQSGSPSVAELMALQRSPEDDPVLAATVIPYDLTPPAPKPRCRIAVYTPALNEALFAQRWADATAEADVRLVADTGSTDDTAKILRAAGVEVVPISVRPWRFDVARNTALSLLPPDVDLCVSLDMDEVPEPGFFEALRDAWGERPFGRAAVLIHTGTWWRASRVHARQGYRWVAPCHEVVVCCTGEQEVEIEVEARITHRPDNDKPRTGYLRMLEIATMEAPTDARMWVYLTRERFFRQDKEGTLASANRVMELPGWNAERAAVCRWAAWAAPDGTEALAWLQRGVTESPGEAESWHALAFLEHAHGHWGACRAAALRGLLCQPTTHYLQDPSVLEWRLHDMLAISCWKMGLWDEARLHAAKASEGEPTNVQLTMNVMGMVTDPPALTASVVVPVWNAWAMTKRCLDSRGLRCQPGLSVVVVDNGSVDETPDRLAAYALADLWRERNDENRGFAAACNQGAWVDSSDIIVFLNNDTVPPGDWLRHLLAPFSDPSIGAVGARSNMVSGPQLVTHEGYRLDNLEPFAAEWAEAHLGQTQEVSRLVGFCLAVRREAFEAIGGFDESFGIGGYEDDDLCRRLSQAGYRLVIADACFVHHEGHVTFDANGQDWFALQEEARVPFEAKWAVAPVLPQG